MSGITAAIVDRQRIDVNAAPNRLNLLRKGSIGGMNGLFGPGQHK
jgi:hypothetical protein